MLFSSNDRGEMAKQLCLLRTEIFSRDLPQTIWGSGPLTYCFPIAPRWQPDADFWVALWPVKIGPMFS
jgi:hypothetical protein